MKIDPTRAQPVSNQPIERTGRVELDSAGAAKLSGAGGGLQSDQVAFSQRALDMQLARRALADVPPVRQELVQSLKARIEAGNYQVDAREVAQKMLGGS